MTKNRLMLYGIISAIIVALCACASSSIIMNPLSAQAVTSGSLLATGNATAGQTPLAQQHQQSLFVGPPLNEIFKKAENSTVQITSRIPAFNSPEQSQPPSAPTSALGSGFVYDTQGHIVTNNHVVDGAQTADITFVDGNKYSAKVIGNDIYSDIAVLKIQFNNTQGSKQQQSSLSLKPLPIGDSSKVEVGDQVIAIGNPFGLSDTMTTGIVSGISRVLPAAGGVSFSIPNAIQTDAPINPGNSGGPLLNIQGQVIGMSTAILSGTGSFSGIGFAIPSNTITKIVPALIQNGTYIHPLLGLTIATLTSDIAQNITGLESAPSNLKGVYVDTITKDGPADKGGVHGTTTDQYSKKHVGDIITAVDGHPLATSDDLITYIDQHKSVGDNIVLTVYRNGHTLDLKVTLAARPSQGSLSITALPPVPPSVPSPPPHSPSPRSPAPLPPQPP